MGIFAALFSSKPKPATPAVSGNGIPIPAKRPSEPERIVATSGIPVAKPNGTSMVPKPVASAAALQMPQPVLPRSITQRLSPRPALPAPRSSEPLLGLREANGSSGAISVTLSDVLSQIPISMLAPNAPIDLTRTLCFPMAQLSAEMARGRPAVSLASIAQQCPELFRHPESIDDTQMVRLPLQKLLEQIGKLKRVDFGNTPRILPPAPMVAQPLVSSDSIEIQRIPVRTEQGTLPSWRTENGLESTNDDTPLPPVPSQAVFDNPARSLLEPFDLHASDTAETITAEIIEIFPMDVESMGRAEAVPDEVSSQPAVEIQAEDYEIPTSGEAPVVEITELDDAILDVLETWPAEVAEALSISQPFSEAREQPHAGGIADAEVIDHAPRPAIPVAKFASVESFDLLPATVQTKVEPGPFVVVGPLLTQTTAPIPEPPQSIPHTRPVLTRPEHPADLAEICDSTPKTAECELPAVAASIGNRNAQPEQAPPASSRSSAPPELVAPRNTTPVIPRFPLRAPRVLAKSSRSMELGDKARPTPPRSPLFSVFSGGSSPTAAKIASGPVPRLFGANPLDRYFSTKAPPPVNWYAAGALLGISGEVTLSRIAEAIRALPGISACLFVAPPNLTVSGEWPASMEVDNSLAFARRLAGVLRQNRSSVVTQRNIVTDSGTLLVFSIDDLIVCVFSRTKYVEPAIRQKLLVITKAMIYACQAVRRSPDSEP